jgi:WD40 repeat protein
MYWELRGCTSTTKVLQHRSSLLAPCRRSSGPPAPYTIPAFQPQPHRVSQGISRPHAAATPCGQGKDAGPRVARGAAAAAAVPSMTAWRTGPNNAVGTAIPLAAANILCASVDWERQEAVFGCADHALYTVDLKQRKKGRVMYGKRYGHTEWVTTVQHLPATGGVVSGGMDSKLCLWDRGRATCQDLAGHAGSISQLVLAQPDGARFISASYDKTLILWDAGSSQQLQRLSGHKAPVLQLCTQAASGSSAAASGDRGGAVLVWDLEASRPGCSLHSAHQGHVTALAWGKGGVQCSSERGLLFSGGQDGCLRGWDCRVSHQSPAAEVVAHVSAGGHGAVSSILPAEQGGHLVVTAGADGWVKAFEGRQGMQQVWAARLPDFPYSMAAHGGLVLVGCGDGSLLVMDRASGSTQYTLAASTVAVRTIHAGGHQLVVGGDDGTALLYEFP